MSYITKAQALELYDHDTEADDKHVFQGDVFSDLSLFVPRAGGAAEWVLTTAVVVSHHCEWTKAKKAIARGDDWPILVAPMHVMADAYTEWERQRIGEGGFRSLLHFPVEGLVTADYAADLRLLQPFSARDLLEAEYLATADQDLNAALRAKVAEYLWRDFTV